MPLAILTIRNELHGFIFLCIHVVPFSIIMALRFGLPELCYKMLGTLLEKFASYIKLIL